MRGPIWKNAAAAIFANQKKLSDNFCPCVFGRQTMPPGKAAHAQQPGTIIENISAADPGDFVTHYLPISYKSLLQVQGVSSIVHHMTFPGDGSGCERFGTDPSRPDFDVLLVRANIVQVAQTCCRATNKATLFSLQYI